MHKEKIILGIDPGTNISGYGVISVKGKTPRMLGLGIIDLRKEKDPYIKLRIIFNNVLEIIDKYHPDEMAIEAPFFGKNVQSMLKLGRAQGVAIAAALYRDIPIFEYAPRKIKMAITGQGGASKEQVAEMLKNLLGISEMPEQQDASDGLAAAMCHFYQDSVPGSDKKYNSWKDFISKNPDRAG